MSTRIRLSAPADALGDLDRKDVWQVSGEATPRASLVAAAPHLAAGRRKVHTHRIARVRGHRLTLYREPGLSLGQPCRVPLPAAASIDRPVHGRLAAGRDA